MARDDHLARLQQGMTTWNDWRHHSTELPDLSACSLRGYDFSGYDLAHTNLRGADLRGARFHQADLTGADLTGANLFKTEFEGANLAAAILAGAKFLNCAQLASARNWQTTQRDDELACGATVPPAMPAADSS